MKPLYLSTAVRQGLGPCLRPGGPALTQRILQLLHPCPESLILDAGCGTGGAMALMQQRGMQQVFGIDIEAELAQSAHQQNLPIALADLTNLPLGDSCLDLILAECVWNLTNREETAAECARVVKPGGHIALSDIYSRSGKEASWPLPCCFSQAQGLEAVTKIWSAAGFVITTLEDHTPLLTHTAAEFVFAHGSLKDFWLAVTGDGQLASAACSATATCRPGFFLLVAKRKEKR